MGISTVASRSMHGLAIAVLVATIAAAGHYGGNPSAVALVPVVLVHCLYLVWAWRPTILRAGVGLALGVAEPALGLFFEITAGPPCGRPARPPGAGPCGPPIGTMAGTLMAGGLGLVASVVMLVATPRARHARQAGVPPTRTGARRRRSAGSRS